jgi:creatinine amidohydrolase
MIGDRELYFGNFSYREVEALLEGERTPVLLFPVGSTEPHGPHSPLSTDPIISAGMCLRAARSLAEDPEIRALILPELPYGVTRYTARFPGAVHVSENALRAMIVDISKSLIAQGFEYIVLVNNHFEPEHVQTLHSSIDTIQEETGKLVGYLDLTRRERAMALTEEFRKGECHAGRYETSLVLADRPELVDESMMRSLPELPINLAKVIAAGHKDFVDMGLTQAYCGSPANATPEEGEETYRVLTNMLVGQVRALARGTGGRDGSGLYGRV